MGSLESEVVTGLTEITEYPVGPYAHELFALQAERTPEATAAVFGEATVSYGELNRRANRLAHLLRKLGVGPDVLVAVSAERSLELLVGLLGVWKAGGAYVPLDPAYPLERLEFMLRDSAPAVLLTVEAEAGRLTGLTKGMVVVDLADGESSWEELLPDNHQSAGLTPAHLAYVIYTSGSTGKPKAVMVEHRNLSNYLRWALSSYAPKRAIVSSSLSFDATVTSLYTPLLSGGVIHIVKEGEETSALSLLIQTIPGDCLVKITPAFMDVLGRQISSDGKSISANTFIVGGEALLPSTVHQWRAIQPDLRIVNEYGPTETVVGSVAYDIPKGLHLAGSVPIGQPIANTQIYILDERQEPVPIGVRGHLHISGAGVTRGYLGRPELTAERFVADPFARTEGARMYWTGDLGRWMADGPIEYLGRDDTQVKIRGYRIELGEIEARLTEYGGVREAVVVAREDLAGDKRLFSYYTTAIDSAADLGPDALRRHLSASLPAYMIPVAYVRLKALPLTANGKVDRKALPEPEEDAYVAREYEAPQGEMEIALAVVWEEVLQRKSVGRRDNFFELGGHSLSAVRAIARLREAGIEVDVRSAFATPTLAELAASLSRSARPFEVPPNLISDDCTAITPEMLPLVRLTQEEIERIVSKVPGGAANVQDIYALAPLQEGILFHYLMGGEGDPYLLAFLWSFDSRQRMDSYVEAIESVINRHDILRTAVMWEGLAEPVQVVMRRAALPVEELKLEPASMDSASTLYARFDPRRYRLDVRQAPLIRLYITYDAQRDRWLMMQLIHHLIGDHVALEIMQEEIQACLQGKKGELPAPLPFRNLVAQARKGVSQAQHEAYFRQLLGDVVEPTAPFGLIDVQGDGTGIKECRMELDRRLVGRIRARSRKLGVSPASLCHLAWAKVLARVAGRADVVFGTVLFGRMQGGQASDRVLGLFINSLPVRIKISEESTEAAVRRTHMQLADLLRHEHASLEVAQRCSGVAAPTPLFTTVLNYLHSPGAAQASPVDGQKSWEGIQMLYTEERTNYPITLSVEDLGEDLRLDAQAPESVGPERICEFMRTALERIVEALEIGTTASVHSLDVLPESERCRILYDWNQTAAENPAARCVPEMFEQQAEKTPEAAAIALGESAISYGELNRRANRLAHYLRGIGVKPDTRVAVCVENSLEIIVALLAVLKAGGACVPLDPAYPEERLQFLLRDSAPLAILAQGAAASRFPRLADAVTLVDLSHSGNDGREHLASNPNHDLVRLQPQHLAYVIYVSGSTGIPRGVSVCHENLINLIAWQKESLGLDCGWRTCSSTGLGSDCVLDIWPPLCAGASVVLPSAAESVETEKLPGWLQNQSIDACFMTAATAGQAFGQSACDWGLRSLIVDGDHLRRLPELPVSCAVINNYGAAEVTGVAASIAGQHEMERVPIGRPIANTQTYILDEKMEPAPIGVSGKIYVAGAGVVRGYLGRPEWTAECFVANPFAGEPGARMYRTGDVARWLRNGEVEYLGRSDTQVMVQGHRIELGEIEARLREHGGVREAVLVAREDSAGHMRLVAYYTSTEASADVGAEVLREHLRTSLPEYMIPASYVRLEEMPLIVNGRPDREALIGREDDACTYGYEPPIGEMETTLAAVWADVLKLDRVGRHDNFFNLGGRSLLAVQVIGRLIETGIELDAREMFATPTLADVAKSLRRTAHEVRVPPNLIPDGCGVITPEMLPLVQLTQEQIDRITRNVAGGAANVQDIYPLAPLQEGIFFHYLMGGSGDAYLLAFQMSFDSRNRMENYLQALQSVINRHDILRTAVMWEGLPEPIQVVQRKANLMVEEISLESAPGGAAKLLYERFDPRHYRIDIRQAPLLHAYVGYDVVNDRWLMMQLMHHLIGDHVALEVMQDEIQAHRHGRANELAPPMPFRNLVALGRAGAREGDHETYFRRLLEDVVEPTAPFGLADVRGDGTGIKDGWLALDRTLALNIREWSRKLGVSTASVCHQAWGLVLARVSGKADVVFGTVLLGRMQAWGGSERALGLFINTLPVRIRIGGENVVAAVQRIHAQLADLLRHEHASLALAQRCSGVAAPAPLFTTLLNYRENAWLANASSPEVKRAWEGIETLYVEERTNYPIVLSVDDLGEGFRLNVQAPESIGAERICELMRSALKQIVEALESRSAAAISGLDVLSEVERRQILSGWNGTAAEYPAHQCVHELFEEEVERSPDVTAVVFDESALSYSELNRRANRLARYLIRIGVNPDARVGICMERSLEMMVALLGVLKAGGAYVPLDPSYPWERMEFMLRDSAPMVLLTEKTMAERFIGLNREMVVVDLRYSANELKNELDTNPKPETIGLTPGHLAYVIYTSGSTGTPKGVMVNHRSVVNRLAWMQNAYGLNPHDVVLQKTPFSFDVSVWEFYWPLLTGARLVMAKPEGHKDPRYLTETICRDKVTTIHFVPSMLQAFLENADCGLCGSLRRVVSSGEALSPGLALRCKDRLPSSELFNLYGPTETTVDVTAWTVSSEMRTANLPIGRPIANTKTYVLDGQQMLSPVGVSGELYVGGTGVSRGYLKRPELTAERFVADPYGNETGARMYRTGDVARWLPDGTLEYLGRNDTQVKIRGFRIELGEIEARLNEHPNVQEAVVVAREDASGQKSLVAYHTGTEGGAAIDAEALREHLSVSLPDYMIPALYVQLEQMPLTVNGKLDRKALPVSKDDAFGSHGYEAPLGPLETVVAGVWKEVLNLKRVGRYDNFFMLGGHSLLAVRVLTRLQADLGLETKLGDLFLFPVLAEFARSLERAAPATLPEIKAAPRNGPISLSFAQQRLWFLTQMEGASQAYHVLLNVRLIGELDATALSRAFERIVVRHEALRTTFRQIDGEPVQQIAAPDDSRFAMREEDLRQHRDVEGELLHVMTEEAGGPFDLERGPLIRGRLLRLTDGEHALLITMHHIVADGWSIGVLLRELSVLYGAYIHGECDPLPALKVQYADYSVWQRQWMEGKVLRAQAEYWKTTLSGAPELLELPMDHVRPPQQDYTGGLEEFQLDIRLTEKLKALSRQHGTTLFMTLLAGWGVLLSRLSGQTDVVIGTPVANRGRAEIEELIGLFVNTLALRLDVRGELSVEELLEQMKRQTVAAQQHQDIPFEQVVELMEPVRSLSHNPLLQVVFAWRSKAQGEMELAGLKVEPLRATYMPAKFDLTLLMQELGETISGEVEYALALFKAETAERYLRHYRTLLESMVEAPAGEAIARLGWLTGKEREQVLYGWNETAEYPNLPCVHELFETQVERTPEAMALMFGEAWMSYGELNRQANQVAHCLRRIGVGPDVRVAVCVERSLEMVVALLGVLKAGGAYVPLNPAYPLERLEFMLQDSAPVALVMAGDAGERLKELRKGIAVLDVGDRTSGRNLEPNSNPNGEALGLNSGHLAYVIYTSGTTGTPKGVMVEHGNVTRLFAATASWFGFNSKDVWSLFHSYAFDFSVWEMWGALLYGGRLIVVEQETTRSPEDHYRLLCREGVTVLNQTPTAFQQLVAARAGMHERHVLRCVIFGGEALEPVRLKTWFERNGEAATRLINMYGITETTVHVTYRVLRSEDAVERRGSPIGQRIPDLRSYILDTQGEPMPVGVWGEIYVGGRGVARGYLSRAALTAERFTANPYGEEGGRMYRTGDVGRWRADGSMEFLGRNDAQVKIRGYRIELGEIEARLREYGGVREAVVITREDADGDKRLVAYYTSVEGMADLGAEGLRAHLQARLPEYMVPVAYVRLERLPLTANGKLNPKALPAPENDAYGIRSYEAPVGEAETMLAAVWAEVLKLERVGRHDNFFELGGDSIRTIMVIAKAGKLGLKLSPDRMFRYQTIASLVEVVAGETVSGDSLPEPLSLISQADRALLPDDAEDAYGLTRLQMGMIFHNEFLPQAGVYHDVFSYQLRVRDWDVSAFKRALEALAQKHPILRTSISLHRYSEPLQIVHRRVSIPVMIVDLTGYATKDQDRMIQEWIESEKGWRFELDRPPLLRVWLHYRNADTVQYSLSFHHAILDGWSVASLHTELFQEYARQQSGDGENRRRDLQPLASTFRGAVAREKEALQSTGQRAFWVDYLAGHGNPGLPVMEEDRGLDGQSKVHVPIPASQRSALLSVANRLHVPLRTVLLAVHLRIMALMSGQWDVVTGLVTHTRPEQPDGEKVLGLFLNTLPFRQILRAGTWAELIQDTFANELRVLPYRRYPYVEMYLENHRAPPYEAAFNYIDFHVYEELRDIGAIEIVATTGFEATNFALAVSAVSQRGALQLNLTFDPERMSKAQIERVAGYYRCALAGVSANSSANHNETDYLAEGERRQVLYEWNQTAAEYPASQCVHELFEAQVTRAPEATAVVCGDAAISYRDLNQRANRLAHYLTRIGVGPDVRVAVCVERSLEMMVGLLAVFKAGGVYVPLDPAYPVERLEFMLQDSAPRALLAGAGLSERLMRLADGMQLVDLGVDAGKDESDTNPMRWVMGLDTAHLAYVIYTSGSTGKPKGVMVTHQALVNTLVHAMRLLDVRDRDVLASIASNAFDISLLETITPWLGGGCTLIVNKDEILNSRAFLPLLREITILHTVPALMSQMLGSVENAELNRQTGKLRTLLIGGDRVPGSLLEEMRRVFPGRKIHVLYGPTEASIICANTANLQGDSGKSRAFIGRPIANMRMYVLDGQMSPVPLGVGGEIYIAGDGVARGYLSDQELTAERFLVDPFAEQAGSRMYRTGDLGRWLSEGTIESLGRNDLQVKIRGYRIELGEIEARLSEHDSVKDVVVVAREDSVGDKRLVAYYTSARSEVGPEQLRRHLSASLPEYMVPAAFVRLEKMPLNTNGKLERKALPLPEENASWSRPYEAPASEWETTAAVIWAEVLNLKQVGRHDNFFELGGHSLLALRVIARLQTALNLEIRISDLFAHPVLADFVRVLQSGTARTLPEITPVERSGRIPLSFAQQRLWFLAQMEGVSEAYHIPLGVRVYGNLNVMALQLALDRIVARHEALRTTFGQIDGEPVQRIVAAADCRFVLHKQDLHQHTDAESELRRVTAEESNAPFNLETGPLIRGRLLRMAEREHALFVTMHHIVSDGWSIGVLLTELNALYRAFVAGESDPLPELRVQYADYSVWQRVWMAAEILGPQAEYWKATLSGAPELLELPTDHVRPPRQDYSGALCGFELDRRLTESLKTLGRRNGTTLFTILLAAWGVLLARLSGQSEAVIGTLAANRGRADIEGLIGFFVNTLALRLDLRNDLSVIELLERVKARVLAAQQHQDIPFEQVVELMHPARSLSHSPLLQVMFAWQNIPEVPLELTGLTVKPLEAGPYVVAKFDLTLSLREVGETIGGGVEFARALFEADTIHRYLGYYRTLLEALVGAEANAPVGLLAWLTEAERQQVLLKWNQTAAEYPVGRCMHELFEAQVKRAPEATAAVFGEAMISYGELNRRANCLAHDLIRIGVGPDARVAICVERSLEMLIGLLGVLKAGGAYVPLDPAYPVERLEYMLHDSAPVALLTQGASARRLLGLTDEIVVVDVSDSAAVWKESFATNPNPAGIGLTPAHLAYVIYTSGSTGMPKGISIEHRSLVNHTHWQCAAFGFCSDDVVFQRTSISFDASVWELWTPLAIGARLVLLPSECEKDPVAITEIVAERNVTLAQFVPSLLQAVIDTAPKRDGFQCRYLFCGGEALSAELAREAALFTSEAVINLYGPAEATIDSTAGKWNASSSANGAVSIGGPIANASVYVLDKYLEPVPVGISGELYIAGAGVARGYLSRAELTAERFVANPFADEQGSRMYRTGDVGRWLRDGTIEFLGRNDRQVKLRGYRIELGEIEARLREHDGIREAVVVLENTAGNKQLVAYFATAQSVTDLRSEVLRTHMAARLPVYMVPAAYVRMESLPRTSNGKLDRNALPIPEEDSYSLRRYEAPADEMEILLAAIWTEVLKLERVGRHDNFFDLGGHSLLVVQVITRLRRAVSVEVSIADLFANPVLADFARSLKRASTEVQCMTATGPNGHKIVSYDGGNTWFDQQTSESV
jgi:amino acid adenylation domain-containing protein